MNVQRAALALLLLSGGAAAQPEPPVPQDEIQRRMQQLEERRREISQIENELRQLQAARRPNVPRIAGDARPPLERALGGPAGRWWARPEMVERLGLTADQQKKMDEVFQQHRLKLIDLNAAMQKEEAIMEPLLSAEQPDENRIVAQIDRVAQARAELEKANARMLLGIRRALTPEQWQKLRTAPPPPPPPQPAAKRTPKKL